MAVQAALWLGLPWCLLTAAGAGNLVGELVATPRTDPLPLSLALQRGGAVAMDSAAPTLGFPQRTSPSSASQTVAMPSLHFAAPYTPRASVRPLLVPKQLSYWPSQQCRE